MTSKHTTITVTKETSAKLRHLAIDEGMRMNVLICALIDSYKENKQPLDFIDDDLKEMAEMNAQVRQVTKKKKIAAKKIEPKKKKVTKRQPKRQTKT